jgi:hypothetical protein
MLISMPTGTSTILGVFQAIVLSRLNRRQLRAGSEPRSAPGIAQVPKNADRVLPDVGISLSDTATSLPDMPRGISAASHAGHPVMSLLASRNGMRHASDAIGGGAFAHAATLHFPLGHSVEWFVAAGRRCARMPAATASYLRTRFLVRRHRSDGASAPSSFVPLRAEDFQPL